MFRKTIFKSIAATLSLSVLTSSLLSGIGYASPAAPKNESIDVVALADQVQISAFPAASKKERQEIKLKRSENSKTYLNPDGTFTTEVYEEPVYYKDASGKWNDIDNTLVQSTSDGYALENKSNKVKSKFSKDDGTSRIELDGNFIEFIPQSVLKKTNKKSKNKASYEGLYADVVIEKLATASGMKENIILNSKKAQTEFTYEVKSSDLTIQKDADGSIGFYDSTQKKVFFIEKPFAYDARGVMTDEVSMDIVKKGKKTYLIQKLSDAWFQDKNTITPVVIDPTVTYNNANSVISDAPVFSCYSTNNYNGWNNAIGVYPSVTGCEVQSLIKFDLPMLYAGQIIDSASLKINTYSTSTTPTNLQVYQLSADWDPSTVTWKTKPSYGATLHDTKQVINSSTNGGLVDINLRIPVRNWYAGLSPNYGILLKAQNPTDEYKIFYRSDGAGADLAPRLTINYHLDPLGLESFWGTDNGVNLLSGNFVEQVTDAVLSGRGMPISATRTYNSRSTQSGELGYGWMFDFDMRIDSADPTKLATLTDTDGTSHVFVYDDLNKIYNAPPGVYYDLVYQTGTSPTFVITDKSQSQYTFDAGATSITRGKLLNAKDNNGNTTTYSYNVKGQLYRITDASGRYVSLDYNTNSRLTSIFGESIPTVSYYYSPLGDLTKVEQRNATSKILSSVTYGYDTNHNLTSITDNRSNKTDIAYDTSDRVSGFTQYVTQIGESTPTALPITYTYGEESINGDIVPITTKTNAKNIVTKYHMDYLGHVVKIEDDAMNSDSKKVITNEFTWSEHNLLTEVKDPRSKSTLLSYDNSGNLIQKTDPNAKSDKLKYNDKSTLIQQTDKNSVSSGISTDANENVSEVYNPDGTSSTLRYDAYGNVVEQTQNIGLSDNLVVNSGFEGSYTGSYPKQAPTGWGLWNVSTSGTYFLSATKINGKQSLALSSPNASNRVIFASDLIPVTPEFTYNTAYQSQFTGVTGDTNSYAKVYVRWYKNKTTQSAYEDTLIGIASGSGKWLQKFEQAESPSDATLAKIFLEVSNGTGIFDNIQFEEGTLLNDKTSVVNSDFELDSDKNGLPDKWTTSGLVTPVDGLDVAQDPGNTVLKLSGTGVSKVAKQTVTVSGKKGDRLVLSGWRKLVATGTPSLDQIAIQINYKDGTYESFPAYFDTGTTDPWKYATRSFDIKKDYISYIVFAQYNHANGTAYFDDLSVVQSIGNNSLMGKYNLLDNSSFERTDVNGNYENWSINKSASPNAVIYRVNNGNAYSGGYSLRASNVTSNIFFVSPNMEPISKDKSFTFSVMARSKDAPSANVRVKFEAYNAAGSLLNIPLDGVTSLNGNENWKRIYVNLPKSKVNELIGAGASQIRPVIVVNGVPATGYVYLDNARFEDGSIVSSLAYDNKSNYLVGEADPDENKASYTTDDRGNITKIQYPNSGSSVEAAYDDLDQNTSIKNATGLRIEYVRDENGNVKETKYVKDSDNHLIGSIKQTFNELNEVTSVTDQLDKTTTFNYDKTGNIEKINYPNGKTANYEYDNVDRVIKIALDANQTTYEYVYDNAGNVESVTKNESQTTSFELDTELDRINSVTYPSGNKMTYNYDDENNVTRYIDSKIGNSSTYQYNMSGNPVYYQGPQGQIVKTMYDEAGRLSKQTVVNGTQTYSVYYTYNNRGSFATLRTEKANGNILALDTYTYDGNGNIMKISHVDGSYVSYAYDASNELISEIEHNASGTATRTITYTYDELGNRTTMNRDGVVTNYNYDAANHLTSYTISASSPVNLSYDEVGNTTQNDKFNFTYNTQNDLIQVKDIRGNVVATYEYDYEGKRTKKVTPMKTEMYYYDGDVLSYITDENNTLRYSFGREANGNLATMTDHTGSTSKTYTYALNYRGDVIGMLDTSGNQVATYSYDSFGGISNQSGSGSTSEGEPLYNENPFKYASYFYDNETNYYYLMARYYDSAQGRFLTRDPVTSSNLYHYVENNPIIKHDPSGMVSKSAIADAVGKAFKYMPDPYIAYKTVNGTLYYDGDAIISHNLKYATAASALPKNLRLQWWFVMVMYNSTWDYKKRYSQKTLYWYKGDPYSGEDFGNIHYGYMGAAAGLSDFTLCAGAGIAQQLFGARAAGRWSSYGDDPRDTVKIKMGISAFKKEHPYLNKLLAGRKV